MLSNDKSPLVSGKEGMMVHLEAYEKMPQEVDRSPLVNFTFGDAEPSIVNERGSK